VDAGNTPLHFVCTRDEAERIIADHDAFWIGECGCRAKSGKCERSQHDVCLEFYPQTAAGGVGRKRVTREHAANLLKVAESKHLVTRPFRDYESKQRTEGICFCCNDCCEYFRNPEEICEKGRFIEKTSMGDCIDCGACAEVCFFMAREMDADKFVVNREKCYGCGLCLDVCPVDCIEMVPRHG
jgi:ferredoxin